MDRNGRTTRRLALAAATTLLCGVAIVPQVWAQADDTPTWAYPITPPGGAPRPKPDPNEVLRVPSTPRTFVRNQFDGLFWVPDWRPEDHPPPPPSVISGHKPDVAPCGYCHTATGDGRVENAGVSGLSKAYIIEQVHQFRDGTRNSSIKDRGPTRDMIKVAKGVSDADLEAAADYFSKQVHRGFYKVVESKTVPKTHITGNTYIRDAEGGTEALGERIVETPDDTARFELRDPLTPYTAFVPPGSIAKGNKLAHSWGPQKTLACVSCHGPQLRGVGDVPPLAGRSPGYLVRELNDFRSGARTGPSAAPMAMVTKDMKNADMLVVAAYIGSLKP